MFLLTKLFGRKPEPQRPAVLTVREYAERYAARVRSHYPDADVHIDHADSAALTRVCWKDRSGASVAQFMGNGYSRYQRQPDILEVLLDEQLSKAVGPPLSDGSGAGSSKIFPVVKSESWYRSALERLRAADAAEPERQFVVEPLAGDLIVVYVEGGLERADYLTPAQRDARGLEGDALSRTALGNLASLLPSLKVAGAFGRYMVRLDSHYDASMVLLFDRWRDAIRVPGEPVFAIPARNELLVCGSEDTESVGVLRSMAAAIAGQSAHGLSRRLFAYRDGGLEEFS